ncbi:hypothetical protein KH172YL63_27100 [Bacillus sp. KH172YL63]|nr:hypothetical protein KH172YL63_27100 [Bacillus sp. KH172YL63]
MMDEMKRPFCIVLLVMVLGGLFLPRGTATAKVDLVKKETVSWTFPVDGYITDYFGSRSGTHKGIDIGGEVGSPVFAVDKGIVMKSYLSETYGHVVFVRHNNGYETVYAHLESRMADEGQEVLQGQQLGTLGNTGRSTGAHLHFEVHRGEWTIDKDYAVDPFRVFGHGEVGELVFANEMDPYQTVDVTASAAVMETAGNHVVSKGDTLWAISQRYNCSVDKLKAANGLIDTQISIGQKLVIPGSKENTYVVKSGDTLFSISLSLGMEVNELVAVNNLDAHAAIYPKQVLKVR